MKGTIIATQLGWYIKYADSNSTIPVHNDNHNTLNASDGDRLDGNEVEFEEVQVCTNCGHDFCDNLACRGHEDETFARLIFTHAEGTLIPPTWDDIMDEWNEYAKDMVGKDYYLMFIPWITAKYNPPNKK